MRLFYRPPENCQIPNLAGKWQALFGRRNSGYFVEVGAYDGENYSNTSCLADVGWSGLYIEPVAKFAERCRARHRNNPAVNVIVAAASDREGSAELFLGGALTTLNQDRPSVYNRIEWARGSHAGLSTTVRTSTLDSLLQAHRAPARFDLLVVDVEGTEEEVFFGFDLLRWRPKVMVIELEDFHPDFKDYEEIVSSAGRVREKLLSAGYAEYHRDIINTIFIDREAFKNIPDEIEFDASLESPVTIGLSVHNGSKTLRRALDGILAQDFSCFDLVISDNASTDETVNIVEHYSPMFERLSVRRRTVKVSETENHCSLLDNCNTQFFVWAAHDDWWEPQFLSKCVACLNDDSATQLVFTDFRIYYHFQDLYSSRNSHVSSDSGDAQLNFLIRLFDMAPSAFYGVYRTAAVKASIKRFRRPFDFSGVVVTLAVALRGKIEIVKEDLFRVGARDEQSHLWLTPRGGRIIFGKFLRDICALAFRGFGLRAAILLVPQAIFQTYGLWRRNQSTAKMQAKIDPTRLYRRVDFGAAASVQTSHQQLRVVAPGILSEQITTFNVRARDVWVKIKGGVRVATDANAFAFRGFGVKAAILLIPRATLKKIVLWYRSID